jgi:hypothetical protein
VENETALPTDGNVAAGEQANANAAAVIEQPGEQQATGQEPTPEGEPGEKPPKREKTDAERERDRLIRRIDNKTRRTAQLEAELAQYRQGAQPRQQQNPADDDEPVTVSRAELDRMVAERAEKLAPAVKEQQAQQEHRQTVVASLAKQWGKEEFNAKAADLDEVMGGLTDRSGRPKPAIDAIFEADNPKGVIEYLTDPDNADEAERIASLSPIRAGRAVALLDAKLKATTDKPQPSKAAKPLEAVRGQGESPKDWAALEGKDFFERRRKFTARR